MRFTLREAGLDIITTEDEKYEMTIAASSGIIRFDEIKIWIQKHLISINP